MTDDCRCLHRAGSMPLERTRVAPSIGTPVGAIERERLADFLNAALMKPLHASAQQHRMNVEMALDTMSLAERIAIEIEMTERSKVIHSYDYDALR